MNLIIKSLQTTLRSKGGQHVRQGCGAPFNILFCTEICTFLQLSFQLRLNAQI